MAVKPLAGRTALVTGGAKRIGREIALALAREGADVAIHYHTSKNEAAAVAAEIAALGSKAWTFAADLGNTEECAGLISRTQAASDKFSILVNSASIFSESNLKDLDFDGLVDQMRINAWAPFVLSREFAARVGHGKIVNLHDTRVAGYDWKHVGYILSKHVLAVLTRMTAYDFAPAITVNAVAPGLILPQQGKDEGYLERLAQSLPLKHHGHPKDVADAVLFFLKSDFVTGQVLYVDGGRNLREGNDGPDFDY